jgi:quercetin dioxygenase-like cupin family protein
MELKKKPASGKGPAQMFTGDVYIDPIARSQQGTGLGVASVHFTPGARTAWHHHHGGQTLHVTEGRGLVQARGEHILEVRAGDTIVTPDGQEHWHGAAHDHFMTHLSITEGEAVWGDHVTDAEYGGESHRPML